MANRVMVARICQHCGGHFERRADYCSKPNRGLFCSMKCTGAGRKQARDTCVGCGRDLTLGRRGTARKYCSHECYARHGATVSKPHSSEHRRAISLAKAGVPLPATRVPATVRICEHCHGPFEVSAKNTRQRRATQPFCTRQCMLSFRRAHPETHHRYRGGLERGYGLNWKAQAAAARERDGHACQDCGLVSRRPLLDVHHIVPRRTFGGDWAVANVLENLVSLCKSCHAKRETTLDVIYGFRNRGERQH